MRTVLRWTAVALALTTLSCASANQLTRKSERELAAGDLRRAYQHARAALVKEPENANARAVFTRVSHQLMGDLQNRVVNIAAVDTVAAALRSRELGAMRADVARLGVALPADPEYAKKEAVILTAAAGIFYHRAERQLSARRPKAAWMDFHAARDFVPNYRDVGRRIDQAFEMAVTHVAILPFADQAGVPGLSRALTDRVYEAAAPRIPSEEYRFTRLVDRDRIYGRMTLAQLEDLTRDEAVAVGRRVDADEIVMGRVYGLQANTNTSRYEHAIFRKVVERDSSGPRERYVQYDLRVVSRERQVDVQYDIEVVGTRDRVPLAKFTQGATAYARVVYTDFNAPGNCADYCLVTPHMRTAEPQRSKEIDQAWKQQFGTWTLPALLEHARKDRSHTRYVASDRQAFFGDCRERPVFLGALPSEHELAGIALDGIWKPVLSVLKELDAKD